MPSGRGRVTGEEEAGKPDKAVVRAGMLNGAEGGDSWGRGVPDASRLRKVAGPLL